MGSLHACSKFHFEQQIGNTVVGFMNEFGQHLNGKPFDFANQLIAFHKVDCRKEWSHFSIFLYFESVE